MRTSGVKTSTSIDQVGSTVLVSISFEDEFQAAVAVEVLRRRQQHGALFIDLQRPSMIQIDGSCERQ